MKNDLDFLKEMISENTKTIHRSLGSTFAQLEELNKARSRVIGSRFINQMEDVQRNLSKINRNLLPNYQKLAQSISIQDQYNLAGLSTISSDISKLANIKSLPLDSFTKNISKQLLEAEFKFSRSFQTVAKVLSDQRIGIPKNVINELRNIGRIAVSDLEQSEVNIDQRLKNLEESINRIASKYDDESIKKYSLGEFLRSFFFYISVVLALYNTFYNTHGEILSNQKRLFEQQQKMEAQLDSLLSKDIYDKIYQIDPKQIEKFRIATSPLLVRVKPNDSSKVKYKLDTNSIFKMDKTESKFMEISFFDFENDKTITGWILIDKAIPLIGYLEN